MTGPLESATVIAYSILLLSAAGAVGRLMLGPRLLDRVVAIDVLAAIIVGLLVVAAIRSDERSLIDVALVVALVSFVGTIAVAHFVEERRRDD